MQSTAFDVEEISYEGCSTKTVGGLCTGDRIAVVQFCEQHMKVVSTTQRCAKFLS